MVINPVNDLYVPYSNFKYKVNQYGKILNSIDDSRMPLIEKDNKLYVELDWVDGKKLYNAATVVIVTYRPNLGLPLNHHKSIVPLYRNLNFKDITPGNLTYKLPLEGIEIDNICYRGFYYIPEYTSYGISKDGKIFNIKNNSLYIAPILPNESLRRNRVSIINDNRHNRTDMIYRLLAMTFLDHDANYERMYINHLNGDRHDDRIENLEWATPSRNSDHAYELGLNPNHRRIKIRNYMSNKNFKFRSIKKISEYFDVSGRFIETAVDRGFMKLSINPEDWYYIKEDDQEWKNISKLDIDKVSVIIRARSVVGMDIFNRDLYIFTSIKETARKFNVADSSIQRHIIKRSLRPLNGFIFRWIGDKKQFPVFTEDQLFLIKQYLSRETKLKGNDISVGYSVLNLETNEKKIYLNRKEVQNSIGINEYLLTKKLRYNDHYIYRDKYRILKIKLKGLLIKFCKYMDSVIAILLPATLPVPVVISTSVLRLCR